MPKIAINWETTAVSFYKFVCKDPTILYSYVGHTTSFSKRKSGHKSMCNNPKSNHYNIPLYVFMREHGGFSNWSMIEIQCQICKDKREAERIENELMEQQQFKLNAQRAFRTEEQKLKYHKQHREQLVEYQSEYYKQHREQLLERQSEYYKQHREQAAEYKSKWCEKNKEKIKKNKAEYYQKKKAEKELSLCI